MEAAAISELVGT